METAFHLGCWCIIEITWGSEESLEDIDNGVCIGTDFVGDVRHSKFLDLIVLTIKMLQVFIFLDGCPVNSWHHDDTLPENIDEDIDIFQISLDSIHKLFNLRRSYVVVSNEY